MQTPPHDRVAPLYQRWSGSRSDTRTQIDNNFESMYDGGGGLLGYVLREPEPGTVPLYQRWSGARSDTRTQAGDQFESMYDGGGGLLGYIFAEQRPGTVELCSRWSGSRSDTRTQIGRDFESMYDGTLVSLGWVIAADRYPPIALDPAIEREVARKFAPTLILHKHDRNRPISLADYVQTVELYKGNERVSANVTLEQLHNLGAEHHLRFKRSPPTGNDEYPTGAAISGAVCDVPAYVHVADQGGYYRVVYALFYALNSFQMFRIGFTASSMSTKHRNFPIPRYARHEGDWEHVTVLVSKAADGRPGALLGVYASQHGGSEYRAGSKVETRNGRPLVYSAINSHANYFGQQTVKYDKIVGHVGRIKWANVVDTTHSDGLRLYHKDERDVDVVWDTQPNLVMADRVEASVFPSYAGRWGRPDLDNSHIDKPPPLPDKIHEDVFALAKAADFVGKIPSRFKVNSGPFGPAYQKGGWWSSADERLRPES